MTPAALIRVIAAGSILILMAALLRLYQHPLMEIHLSTWGLC